MTDRVHIKDADALDRFAVRLSDYEAGIRAARHAVESDTKRTLDYLGERYRLWKRRYEAWCEEADRLWSKLERCAGDRLDRRARTVRIPKECDGLWDQYEEAVRRRNEAQTNMMTCDSLYKNVQDASEAYRRQAGQVEGLIGEEVSTGKHSLTARAAKARALAAHRFSGSALEHAGPVGTVASGTSPLGGTESVPTAQWTVGFSGSGFGGSPNPAGTHETDAGEGPAKEGEPDPEGAEGPVQHVEESGIEREPPLEWTPGGERK